MKQNFKLTAILIVLTFVLYAFMGCDILKLFVGDESESVDEVDTVTESELESLTELVTETDMSDESQSESDTEDGEFSLTREALARYVIVVPNEFGEEMDTAAKVLQGHIEKVINKKLEIKTDIEAEAEYEILIGCADREVTVDFYKDLGHFDWGYALVDKKLLICANVNELFIDAVGLFYIDILNLRKNEDVLMAPLEQNINKDPTRNEEYEWLERSKEKYYADILEDVTINALGDSYFGGSTLGKDKTWLALLKKKYGLGMNNYGIGGSTVSNYVTNNNPMCDRYVRMADNNADIIIIEGGRNDFNNDVPIGEVDSYDTETFSGALNVIVEGVKERYPNAMIVCISNWNFPDTKYGRTYLDYADAMEAVAERQEVYFIRACDPKISGVDMSSDYFRRTYCLKSTDVSHLNLQGMKLVMERFEVVLAEYYLDFLSKK